MVLVCPEQFRPAMASWVAYRQSQGHTVAIVSNLGTTDQIQAAIRRASPSEALKAVVLVGDVEAGMQQDAAIRRRCVPVHWARAVVNVRVGSEPHISTDQWCADLDADGVPEVAVGRLTADSAEDVAAMVEKIIAYECSADFGPWRRRLNFVAGVGGFGALADTIIENSARMFLTHNIAPAYQVAMTYASWRSPFCPDPRLFRQTTLQSLNSGCQFWIYMGHGYPMHLDQVRVPGAEFPILSTADGATPLLLGKADRPVPLLLRRRLRRLPGLPC